MIRFESGGRHFQLERDFTKKGRKTRLFCLDDGEELSEEKGDLQALLMDLDSAGFENTVAVGQLKAQPERNSQQRSKIMRPIITPPGQEIWIWKQRFWVYRSGKKK